MICIYNQNGGPMAQGITTPFSGMGLGTLSDAISCKVSERLNGEYTATLTYPTGGANFDKLQTNAIFTAKPNPYEDAQPFRIKRITKPIGGIVTVYAEHIRYDLGKIPVQPFTATGLSDALQKIKQNELIQSRFTFSSLRTSILPYAVRTPRSISSVIGGGSGSILDAYGGEWAFDGYNCTLYETGGRGQNRGVAIRYGKNMTDLRQEENIASLATGVYPFWVSAEDGSDLLTLPEKIVSAQTAYPFEMIEPLDLSQKFSERPTVAQLRQAAEDYIEENKIGIPKVSLTVNFVSLAETEEYREIATLERVSIGDTVRVVFHELGVDATARVEATTFDAVKERYDSVEIGAEQQTAAGSITDAARTATNAEKRTDNLKNGLIAGTTTVNGDCIRTGTIESNNYQEQTPEGIYSAQGTLLKLLDGVIKSPFFAVAQDGTVHLGGFRVKSEEILGETVSVFEVEDENGQPTGTFSVIGDEVIVNNFWIRPADVFGNIKVSMKGVCTGADDDFVEISNQSGQKIRMIKNAAGFIGHFVATPYTESPEETPSEIVTKQDLINLGLIQG